MLQYSCYKKLIVNYTIYFNIKNVIFYPNSNFALTSNRTNSVSAPFKGKLYTLWPEFNENDINAEKWVS